jgi:hypothetical protein
MTTDAESNAMTLKERLQQGEYNVDTKKVADAIVSNPLWVRLLAGSECWPHTSGHATS